MINALVKKIVTVKMECTGAVLGLLPVKLRSPIQNTFTGIIDTVHEISREWCHDTAADTNQKKVEKVPIE